jgi:16S rRNA (guanine966-N2)-methyltransferase
MREALFNILSSDVKGAHVLDLFAGTGALGIEALSRGAASVVFIDRERAALAVIENNVKTCRLEAQSRIIRWNIVASLTCLNDSRPLFDLVFMDPPYETGCVRKTLENLYHSDSLSREAVVVVEHSPKEPVPDIIFGFEIMDRRRYSKTSFSFLRFGTQAEKEVST